MKLRRFFAGTLVLFSVIVMIIILVNNRKQYVILVSMDGFRWDYPEIYITPNLESIAAKGVKAGRLIPSFPTNTFPNHYTLATGLYPDHHGLINNSFYAPDLDLFYSMGNRERVENPDFYDGEPIWNTAGKNGIITASMFWVGSEAPVNGMQPTYWNRYDKSIPYKARIDSVINWLSLQKKERPRFITLYFDEPDAVSHDYGPFSAETDSVVRHLDSLIGQLVERVGALPISKRINLIIVSDHGMGEISNERLVNLWKLIPAKFIERYGGGNPVYLIDPAESYGDTVISILDETRGVKGYFKDDIPDHFHYGSNPRIPDIVAVADSAWSIVWVHDSSYVMHSKATHGWDPVNSEMHGIFYAKGRSFTRQSGIERLDNVDIYNLICEILDIEPAPNDGSKEKIKGLLR
ncbi:MAG TPA: ectonucleotide pyrophosphatase/phosphodiesterase [Bacteroidales bacterium]|nr:ectonucleotide pyrophosphatase/phosphodiesterase [Bacteroidales bacterium]